MYLSRVEIDTKNRQKMKDLTNLRAFHGWVEQSFPKEIAKGERLRHLWRIDILQGRSYLLLLSPDRPDLNRLSKYGIAGTAKTKDYEETLNGLRLEQIRPFRLTANAVYRDRKTGKLVPYTSISDIEQWLLKRAERLGFEVVTSPSGKQDFMISDHHSEPLRHGRKAMPVSMTSYEGVLKITDVAKLKETLANGVGRERAYGCGLLTVMPEVNQIID